MARATGRTRRSQAVAWAVLALVVAPPARAQKIDDHLEPHRLPAVEVPPAPALPPAEAMKTIRLAPGFRLELVAHEPLVQDPITLTFDEDGRMWVVEMRGFMPDYDGNGESEPTGRISVLEDVDGDGRADRSTIFLDKLIMPRTVSLVAGGALVVHDKKLWMAYDRDGDLRADEVTLLDDQYAMKGNPEHQSNGLFRAMDNWFYSGESNVRYRHLEGRWQRQETERRAQWGLAQDDYGRLFYSYNYDQLRADVAPSNALGRNPHHVPSSGINTAVARSQAIFPIRPNTSVNRGYRPGVLDERGRLLAFTAAGGTSIFRSLAFGPEFYGNAFVPEPSGNLVKRNLVEERPLSFTAEFAYPDSEFLASTDERFRPVFAQTGPDGLLYIVDMYRGLIQHAEYLTRYLREESQKRALHTPIHLGRIYRVVRDGYERRGARPQLSPASHAQLVETLQHPEGWWRDTAQRLLVQRRAFGAIPSLIALALGKGDPRGRVHALWTLEALAAEADPGTPSWPPLRRLLPLVRTPGQGVPAKVVGNTLRVLSLTAIRDKALGRALEARLPPLAETRDPELAMHVALALGLVGTAEARLAGFERALSLHADQPIVRDAVLAGLEGYEGHLLRRLLARAGFRREREGVGAVLRALAAAVVREGRPERVEALFALMHAQRRSLGWRRRWLAAGLADNDEAIANEPVRLTKAPPHLQELSSSSDGITRGLLERGLQLLAWPGHEPPRAPRITDADLSEAQKVVIGLGEMHYFQTCAPCHGIRGEGLSPLAPPLVRSEWVAGSPDRLLRIMLHGLEGPIHVRGERFEPPRIMPAMPEAAAMPDNVMAAVADFVRLEFAGLVPGVTAAEVARLRKQTAARGRPYTEDELRSEGGGAPGTHDAMN